MVFVFLQDSRIEITKNYYDDLIKTQNDLKQCKLDQPKCPDVKCTEGASGIVWSIMGMIFLIFSIYISNKKDKEIKDREKEIEIKTAKLNARILENYKRLKKR